MTLDGSARAVVTALVANLGIAAAKFVAAGITGSASMLAEGVHSVADSGNQILLLIGRMRARQAPSALHPFGHARERYVYAFLVAVVLFTVGGLYALYEGYRKITDSHPLTSPTIAMAVLLIAMALEGHALRTAVREANRTRGPRGWFQFVRDARAPELPVILLEDSAALVGLTIAMFGVGLTGLTGNGVFDGVATLCIGVLLAAIAALLAARSPACSSGRPLRRSRSTRSTPRCSRLRASTRSSICAHCTSDRTNCLWPARSGCLQTPTVETSPPRSTTPKRGFGGRCPAPG